MQLEQQEPPPPLQQQQTEKASVFQPVPVKVHLIGGGEDAGQASGTQLSVLIHEHHSGPGPMPLMPRRTLLPWAGCPAHAVRPDPL